MATDKPVMETRLKQTRPECWRGDRLLGVRRDEREESMDRKDDRLEECLPEVLPVLPVLPVPTNVAIFAIILDNKVNILLHLCPNRVFPLKSLKIPLK